MPLRYTANDKDGNDRHSWSLTKPTIHAAYTSLLMSIASTCLLASSAVRDCNACAREATHVGITFVSEIFYPCVDDCYEGKAGERSSVMDVFAAKPATCSIVMCEYWLRSMSSPSAPLTRLMSLMLLLPL